MIKFQRSLRGGFQSRLSSRAAATIKGERTKKDERVEIYNRMRYLFIECFYSDCFYL